LALAFSTTDKEAIGHGIKVLAYGNAGAGKTRLCGTAPMPLIISAEAGLLSLRHKKIPVVVVNDIKDVEEAFTWCQLHGKKQGILTLGLDSISEITEKCLAAEKIKNKDPRAAYGEMAGRIIELVKKFRDLPGFNVVVTAKQTQIVDAITGVAKAVPIAPGQQVGPALPYLFDEVFHIYTDKDPTTGATYHAIRTHASFNCEAKDRSGVLAEIEYPDLAAIFHKIQTTAPTA
jgi:hypothetical protein